MADQKPRLMQNGWMMAPDAPRIFHPGSAPQHRPPGIADDDKGEWVYNFRPKTPSYTFSGEGTPFGEADLGEEYIWMTRPEAPAEAPAPPREKPDDVPDRKYNIFDYSPQGWDDYTEVARQETLGMNRMPFVGPNGAERGEGYQDIPYDPLLALEMIYPGASNQWREKLRDPLEGSLLKAIAT